MDRILVFAPTAVGAHVGCRGVPGKISKILVLYIQIATEYRCTLETHEICYVQIKIPPRSPASLFFAWLSLVGLVGLARIYYHRRDGRPTWRWRWRIFCLYCTAVPAWFPLSSHPFSCFLHQEEWPSPAAAGLG